MIQEFGFALSPALARRLSAISAICDIRLDDTTRALAGKGLLAEDGIERATPMRRNAAQFLLDCDLRAVLPAVDPQIDHHLVLETIRAAGNVPLTILSRQAGVWRKALRGSGLASDALLGGIDQLLDLETIKGRRDGVLVMDWTHAERFSLHAKLAVLAREFPRTLIYCDTAAVAGAQQADFGLSLAGTLCWAPLAPRSLHWEMMARVLFPDMPREALATSVAASRTTGVTHCPAWRLSQRDDLCVLFNVFLPHILVSSATQANPG